MIVALLVIAAAGTIRFYRPDHFSYWLDEILADGAQVRLLIQERRDAALSAAHP